MQAIQQGQSGRVGRPRAIEFRNWDGSGHKGGALPAPMQSFRHVYRRRPDQQDAARGESLSSWPASSAANAPKPGQAKAKRLTGPIQFILKLLEFWRLRKGDAVNLLGFDQSDADHVEAVLNGSEQFRGRDVKDRIGQLYSIRKSLWSLFQDLDAENGWLREPQPLLDGNTPLTLLGGSMEDLLWLRDYVDEMAGR